MWQRLVTEGEEMSRPDLEKIKKHSPNLDLRSLVEYAEDLEVKLKVAVDALETYADDHEWVWVDPLQGPRICEDDGEIARDALAKIIEVVE